jgi:protein O-mannosyl-transferase
MPSKSRITPDRAVLAGLLVTAAIYCRDLKYDFILDDLQLILMNPITFSWHNLKMIFTTDAFFTAGPKVPIAVSALHYRPVFMLWMMLNQQLFGSVLPWWHLTSLLLHLGVTFLVYKLGVKMLKQPWAAALAALLFAFHPIHVESVSYVSASTDLLVTLFLLISFLAYARFREEGASQIYFSAAVVAAALAMLSKETGAMFPWALVAYEALREMPPGTRRNWKQFLWTLPFFGIVAAYAAVRTLLFGHNLGPGPGGNRLAALADVPLVLIAYLRNLLWSFRLSFFYPAEWAGQWSVLKACAVVAVVAAAALLWQHFRDRPNVRLQLLWAAIFFVPPLMAVSAFVREDWVHDRHMYLVSVPFFLLVAALLTDPKLPKNASLVACSVILLGLSVETAVQVPRFSDGVSIYESALKVAPGNALARRYLAFALCSYGRYEEAFREFRVAEELWPRDPVSYGSYGEALGQVGRNDEAAEEYKKALQWSSRPTPYRAFLLYRLASIKVKESDAADGERYLREAIRIAPDAPSYHAILAEALRRQGRTQEADQQMQLEARVQKNFAQANAAP